LNSVNAIDTDHENRSRAQVNASLSHHAADFIKGSHDFKFGLEFERSTVHSVRFYNGGIYYLDYVGYGYTGNYLRFINEGYDTRLTLKRTSMYAQDQWEISNKLRADVGVRLDVNRGSIEGKGTPFKTNPVAPRLGLTYDIMGDHKTIVKAHYGHYYEAMLGSYFSLLDDRADLISQYYSVPTKEWVTFSDTVHDY